MNARQNKHSGRIEVKPGLKVINGAAFAYQAVWKKACEHDKIDPKSKFICFSSDNPYVQFLNNVRQQYLDAISGYQSGGYVGLKMS